MQTDDPHVVAREGAMGEATHTLELELCAFALACLRAHGGDVRQGLDALITRALSMPPPGPDHPGEKTLAPDGPWIEERVELELAREHLVAIESRAGQGRAPGWVRALVHAWAGVDVPRLPGEHVATLTTIELCVSSLDLMSVRQRIANAAFLGRAHAVDEAARHWLGHRERADRARALTLYLDGSHHSGALVVAVDTGVLERVSGYADEDGGHVIDAVYWGLAHMLGHIT